ncbi:T6SS immunity protein Tdi1 domain-containing protein [Spirochaeta cellobiosiphila]|uniref:T6SS immunity protein Tdi1 domain-containing protein n=1 Tax=Spirochaeta cellobiosiphila TaxID=504483 RepID=UPI000414FBD5|nr:T6SS immunity protein Tdi1 domain-containing protein [Spirochaeta cellobiosiphila]
MNKIALQKFVESYKPGDTLKADVEVINKYKEHLPECMTELWSSYGFGFYGEGIIQIINPDKYIDNLWGWLGQEENYGRVPVAISSFGIIFYYRQLDSDIHDIAYIDPQTSATDVLSWDIESFFNQKILDEELRSVILDKDLNEKAQEKYGPLAIDEMYSFVPAIRLGGTKSPQNIDKCNAPIHLDILLQLALG